MRQAYTTTNNTIANVAIVCIIKNSMMMETSRLKRKSMGGIWMLNKIKEFFRRPPEFLDSKVEEWDEIKRLGNEIAKEMIEQYGIERRFETKVVGRTISNQETVFLTRFIINLDRLDYPPRGRTSNNCHCKVGKDYFKLMTKSCPSFFSEGPFTITYDDLLRIKAQIKIILEELR